MKTVNFTVLILVLLTAQVSAQEPFEGQTLISPLNSEESYLIDMDNNVTKTWRGNISPAALAYLLPDSAIIRPCLDPNGQFPHGGAGGNIQKIDTNDIVVWDYFFSTYEYQQHHDVEPMPDGNVLIIAWERKTREEAMAAGRQAIPGEMWPTLIAEVEPDGLSGGNIVWEWHIWDHLIQEADPTKENYGVVADRPELVDINYGGVLNHSWIHANAIDYNPELDQIVFSSRKLNEIFVIDHSTTTEEAAGHEGGNSGHGGDILYRWGNPQVYGRGTEEDQNYWGVHGAIWIDAGLPGAGNILTFNNGNRLGTVDDYSSVEEIAPPRDNEGNYIIEPGEPFGPAALTWYYENRPGFYSVNIGGAFRMPNGNTLICEGESGYIFEVTQLGVTVWQYIAPADVHRAPRYWDNPVGVGDSIERTAYLLDNYPNQCGG
jgi:hypothetical protein